MEDMQGLKLIVYEDQQLLIFRVDGEIDSHRLTDDIIAAYLRVEDKWHYRRVFDYRRAIGLYAYEEVERLLEWWHTVTKDRNICHFVAVVTQEILFEMRARAFNDRYEKGEIRSFPSLQSAVEWLDNVAPAHQALI